MVYDGWNDVEDKGECEKGDWGTFNKKKLASRPSCPLFIPYDRAALSGAP